MVTLHFTPLRKKPDRFLKGMFIGLAIVLLVFFGSMLAVLMMHAPRLPYTAVGLFPDRHLSAKSKRLSDSLAMNAVICCKSARAASE